MKGVGGGIEKSFGVFGGVWGDFGIFRWNYPRVTFSLAFEWYNFWGLIRKKVVGDDFFGGDF